MTRDQLIKFFILFVMVVGYIVFSYQSNKNSLKYQAKLVEDAQVRKEIAKDYFKFCPICKQDLAVRKINDSFSTGLECENNHSFHIPLENFSINETSEKFLLLHHDSTSEAEIARVWLTNLEYRRHLSGQLAEVLRLFLEMDDKKYNQTVSVEGNLKFCPICGKTLGHIKDYNDSWMVGRKCKNDHDFGERGWYLSTITENDVHIQIALDYDMETLESTASAWLKDKKYLKQQLPDQVRELLIYYLNKYSDELAQSKLDVK